MTEENKINFYKLIYTDGKDNHEARLHAPTLEIAKEHAEMSEFFADMTFVSSEELEPLKHNISE